MCSIVYFATFKKEGEKFFNFLTFHICYQSFFNIPNSCAAKHLCKYHHFRNIIFILIDNDQCWFTIYVFFHLFTRASVSFQ